MKILICPDSFKGTLSAIQVAKIIGDIFEKAGHFCTLVPVADGGEGTGETLLYELGGKKRRISVCDPLGRKIKAFYGLNGKHAYIEMAESSGLDLLKREERDPWKATTYGVGQMIKDALDHNVKEIFIGIGGSATNDVGIGMAQALGVRFFDKDGKESQERKEEGYGACSLGKVAKIDDSQIDPRIRKTKITVFSDVKNPLYGKSGATFTYSKQKGARKSLREKLEKGVRHFAKVLKKHYEKNPNFRGAGAAGGLGAGLNFFLGATLVPGIEAVIELLKLENKIKKCDMVIVGEGQMDFQTVFGKAPIGIAKRAKKFDKKVIAIVGKIGKDVQRNFRYIDHIFSCYGEEKIDMNEVMLHSRKNMKKISKLALQIIHEIDSYKYQLTILS